MKSVLVQAIRNNTGLLKWKSTLTDRGKFQRGSSVSLLQQKQPNVFVVPKRLTHLLWYSISFHGPKPMSPHQMHGHIMNAYARIHLLVFKVL